MGGDLRSESTAILPYLTLTLPYLTLPNPTPPYINPTLPFLTFYLTSPQVLSSEGLTFLRLANDRGWTYARCPTDGGVLFEDLAGGVSEDT